MQQFVLEFVRIVRGETLQALLRTASEAQHCLANVNDVMQIEGVYCIFQQCVSILAPADCELPVKYNLVPCTTEIMMNAKD